MFAVAVTLLQHPPLDPFVRRSNSGEFVLEVDPSDPEGRGWADYRLEQDDSLLWSGDLPFTLHDAAVADSGVVIGYSYSEGHDSARGELQLIRIDPSGTPRFCGALKRRVPDAIHGGPMPTGHEIVLDEVQDLAIVGVRGASSWFVRVSTGECLPPTRRNRDISQPPPPPKPVFSEPPAIELDLLGMIDLGGSRSEHEVACVERATALPDEGPSVLRPTSDWEGWELVVRGPEGSLRTVVALGDLAGAGRLDRPDRPQALRTGEHTWVVLVSEHGESPTHAWTVDDRSLRVEAIHGFACPAVWGLAPLPDGGFAVLANRRGNGESVSTLLGFDRDGTERWRVGATSDPADTSRLLAPGSVVATADGELVVRDPVRGLEQRFDSGGSFQGARTIPAASRPARPNGARKSVGLGRFHALVIDSRGFAHAVRERTPSISVFDPTGRRVRIIPIDPAELEGGGPWGPDCLTLGPDGGVYVQDDPRDRSRRLGGPHVSRDARRIRYLGFDADGSPCGTESLGFDQTSEKWRFAPNGDCWVLGYSKFARFTPDGTAMRIERQPDRRWIQFPEDAAVAPDGSVALLASRENGWTHEGFGAHLYAADGTPLQSLPMPPDSRSWGNVVAWNGRWLVVARERGRFHLVHVPSGRRSTFVPDWVGAAETTRDPFLAADGRELWIADRGARIVRRYSLPGD